MIEKRPFGRTGHMSTATIFGAAALWQVTQEEADQTLDTLLQYGVNHIDVANSYGDAEERIGPWMDRHRDQFFLATKTENRDYKGAMEHLHRSLDLLHTDHIDLWQMHFLLKQEEWDQAMGPGGVLEAFIEARDKGLVRFLGVTGHELAIGEMHLQSLRRFDFDSVLLPYNFALMQNPSYAAVFEQVVALCKERNTAVQTIKSQARRPWGHRQHTAATWYDVFTEQQDIDRAVHWVLSRGDVFLNTPGDIHILPKVLDAASRLPQASADEISDAAMRSLDMEPLFV